MVISASTLTQNKYKAIQTKDLHDKEITYDVKSLYSGKIVITKKNK